MRSLRKLFAASTAITAAAIVSVSASPASAVNAEWFKNGNSGLYLGIQGDEVTQGATVVQRLAGGEDSSTNWLMATGDNSPQAIQNWSSRQCLAIPHGSTTQGVAAIQWPCNGSDEQKWIWDSANRLRNVASNLCLAIGKSSTNQNAPAIQWPCSTNTDQVWNHSGR